MVTANCTPRVGNFRSDKDGAATEWSILGTAIFLVMGGLTIDTAYAFREQEFLQVTADAAAHAGAVELAADNPDDAKIEAVRIAGLNMRPNIFGSVLKNIDITTGRWDHENRVLDTTSAQPDAVRVITRRSAANSNSVKTILMNMIGFDNWNLGAMATVQNFQPTCIMDGVVADGIVEISSNNSYFKGYCLHGQQGIKISSNNFFEGKSGDTPGTIVSMNDLGDLQLPASGFETNLGLADALRSDWMRPRAVDKIAENMVKLADPGSDIQPDYINSLNPAISVNKNQFDPSALVAGSVYDVRCNGNQQISLSGVTISEVVIVTNCRINFGAGTALEDVIIATSNTNGGSIHAPSGVRVGKDDNCTSGGGATLMTAGGMTVAAGLEAFGSQFIAASDITVSADANGIEGASFQTGGDFKMTSNGVMGNCTGNVDDIIVADYYRIVE